MAPHRARSCGARIFATLGGGITLVDRVEPHHGAIFDASPKGVDVIGATVFAPVFEEGFKGLGVAIIALASALGLHELDGPLDGAIYGGIVGLGFTLTEDILYVANQFADERLRRLRVPAVPAHGAARPLALHLHGVHRASASASPSRRESWFVKIAVPVIGFGCAMLMHAMHNALPTFFGDGGLVLMLLVSWGIDILFFVLLALLVVRDRTIVIRELFGEVGNLLHPKELQLVSSYFALGLKNWGVLFSRGWSAFRAAPQEAAPARRARVHQEPPPPRRGGRRPRSQRGDAAAGHRQRESPRRLDRQLRAARFWISARAGWRGRRRVPSTRSPRAAPSTRSR